MPTTHGSATTGLALTRHRLLSAREEKRLGKRIQAGDREARDLLIRHNLRLVHKIAAEYRRGTIDMDDLVQEGVRGLIRAADKFDPALKTRFSTYATYWIRQAIGRYVAAASRPIHVPAHAHDQAAQLARATQRLAASLGRTPTVAERADATGFTPELIEALDRADEPVASLASLVGDGDAELADFVADTTDPAEQAEHNDLRLKLRQLLDHLTPRQRRVIALRFGLDDHIQRTYEAIAETIGISAERVRQIERHALRHLRRLAIARLPEYRHG